MVHYIFYWYLFWYTCISTHFVTNIQHDTDEQRMRPTRGPAYYDSEPIFNRLMILLSQRVVSQKKVTIPPFDMALMLANVAATQIRPETL